MLYYTECTAAAFPPPGGAAGMALEMSGAADDNRRRARESEGPMELTVQNVYGLLLRSKLLSIDEARAMYARWQAEAKDGAGNLSRFASWLVANKFATEYQASLLVRGHADGFFLNDYKILDRLGKGRMAGVYKVQHRLGQIFAIKVLPPSRAAEPNLLGRFQREAKLAMRLKHPNVVRAFQVGQAGGLYYLVMEYLEGETLEDVLLSARNCRRPRPCAWCFRPCRACSTSTRRGWSTAI